MRAVRVVAPGKLEVADVAEPVPNGDALIRVHRVGICGTDVKILAGAIPADYPLVMGHEMVGEVVQPGSLGLFTAGQRVMVDPATACGHCDLCREGRPNVCINGGLMGRDIDGVFSEYTSAPETRLLAVPEVISDKASGVLQVLGTCIHAQRAVAVFPGDVVAVIGLGVSGQIFVQMLRARGAVVIGITRSEWKRQLAAAHGAVATASPDDAAAVVAELTQGRGADIVVESAGYEATLAQSVELTRTGGEVLVFGTLTGGDKGLPYYQLYHKELTIYNPRAALTRDYQRGIELTAAGVLDLEPIVTHNLTLSDAAEAFSLVKDPASMKILMEVG